MTMIKPVWEGVYQNFSEAPIYGDGYNGDEWIRQSLQKMIETKKWANEASLIPPLSNHREILLPFLAALVYQERAR